MHPLNVVLYTHEQVKHALTEFWKCTESTNVLPVSRAFSPEANTTAQLVGHFVQKIVTSPNNSVLNSHTVRTAQQMPVHT